MQESGAEFVISFLKKFPGCVMGKMEHSDDSAKIKLLHSFSKSYGVISESGTRSWLQDTASVSSVIRSCL